MKLFWFLGAPQSRDSMSADKGEKLQFGGLSWIIWVFFLVLIIFTVWANWAVIDQITRAPGAVIASTRTQVIQTQDGGTIENLLVREGDVVEAGQALLRFEKTRFEAGYLEARAKAVGLAANVARLKAEVEGLKEPKFPAEVINYPEFRESQLRLLMKRRGALDAETSATQTLIDLIEQELQMTEPLLKTGDVSRTEILRLQRQRAELSAQLTNKRNKYFQDTQAELNKAQEDLASVQQNQAQRKSQLEGTELYAPVRGIVKNVRITTLGGVVRPGDEVMQIVPLEDTLIIQAKVSPSDIAFLRIGQLASIKIDAYDYTIYGDLTGKLTYISADTLSEDLRQNEQPYYRVQVQTQGRRFSAQADKALEILPGMTASIEIKTGSRSVLQYLLKPVTKTISESLGER